MTLGALVLVLGLTNRARPDESLGTDPAHNIPAQFAANGLGPVLTRACGDCHSNTASLHWSVRVPPVSWVMARAAQEGRKAVNFAEWSTYPRSRQQALLLASCADAKSGRMPGTAYARLRPDARLTRREVESICEAAR
jgi:hypothetical protein